MSSLSGVPYDLIPSRIQQWFHCSFCHRLLVEPICTTCGDRYCSLCFEKIMKNKQAVVCFANDCDELLTYDKTYWDAGIENDLKHFTGIVCHNKLNGCSWQGDYIAYKDHIEVCTLEDLQCKCCLASFTNRLLYEQHYSICPKASIACSFKKVDWDIQICQEDPQNHILSSFENQSMIIRTQRSSTSPALTCTVEKLNIESINQDQINVERNLLGRYVKAQQSKEKSCKWRKEDVVAKLFFLDDGRYLWCIDHIHELFQYAKITSEPMHVTLPSFYISKYGYKLALKLYLNGDKTTRNTHLSLYVTIMHDDESLHNSLITLYLYDTSSKNDHIVYTLIPDINSEYCQQPRLDKKQSIKISEFCPLSLVFDKDYGYVKDDTMFIEAFLGANINTPKIGPK